jgi:hypothetical protein
MDTKWDALLSNIQCREISIPASDEVMGEVKLTTLNQVFIISNPIASINVRLSPSFVLRHEWMVETPRFLFFEMRTYLSYEKQHLQSCTVDCLPGS